jgi:hypothetical protein
MREASDVASDEKAVCREKANQPSAFVGFDEIPVFASVDTAIRLCSGVVHDD